MNGLTCERDSPILDASGKPYKVQEPVRVDRDVPTDFVFMLRAEHNLHFKDDESARRFARGCAVMTNVRRP